MKLIHLGSGVGLIILGASCAAPIVDDSAGAGGAPAAGVGGNGAGGTAVGAGGAAVGSGGAAVGAGGTAVGAGGAAVGSGGAAVGSGGAAVGSGGAAVGSGGAATSSGGAAATACQGGGINNGLVDNGDFCGYAWTAANGEGETIDPPCDGGPCFEASGTSLCATGSIPANVAQVGEEGDADYVAGSYPGVMIGINAAGEGESWTATGTGISVTFAKGGATGVARVMVQSAGKDYCADAVTSGANLAWSDFSVACWEGGAQSPEFAAGGEVDAFVVQINGSTAAQTFTDFCVTDIVVN